jgi:hypothetical protein
LPVVVGVSGIRNQESGIRNQESGIRDQGSGIRDQGSGIRDRHSARSLRQQAKSQNPHAALWRRTRNTRRHCGLDPQSGFLSSQNAESNLPPNNLSTRHCGLDPQSGFSAVYTKKVSGFARTFLLTPTGKK